MKQRIITGILFTLVMAAFVVPGYWTIWPPLFLFAAVAVLASLELVHTARQCGLVPGQRFAVIGSLFMLLPLFLIRFLPADGGSLHLLAAYAVTLLLLMAFMTLGVMARLIDHGPKFLPDALVTGGIMAYVAIPLLAPVLLLLYVSGGWLWVIIGLSAPWMSDVFAYFTGSLLGRHPAVPRLSPKKTLEGCLGGIAGSMALQVAVFYLFRNVLGQAGTLPAASLLFALLSGLVLSIASQLGDWLASAIKRYCGVKDFGHLLPGHGGLMDRFDSAFFTLPVTLALAMLYQVIGA